MILRTILIAFLRGFGGQLGRDLARNLERSL